MFDYNFDIKKFQLDKEIVKFRQILQLNRKFIIKEANSNTFYGIKNFWIISHAGITLFSLKNLMFSSQDEKDLFGGFITAIISISEVLTKGKLTEIKVDNQVMYIQIFNNYFIVSIIDSNNELSLKFLEKLSLKYESEISNSISSHKIGFLKSLNDEYLPLQNDDELKRKLIFETGSEYLSKYIFGLCTLDRLYQKLNELLAYLSTKTYHEFLDSLYLYMSGFKHTNVNSELVRNITIVLEGIYLHIQYSNEKTDDNYVKFIKNNFLLFLEFINQDLPNSITRV